MPLSDARPEPFAPLPTCLFNEDPPHGRGGRGEEVPSRIPVRYGVNIDKPDVRLVNQCRGLQRLARLLLSQLLSR